MKEKFMRAKKMIEGARHIVLATHEEPDGDALGSMLGLGLVLEKMGKQTILFCATATPAEFNFLPQVSRIKDVCSLEGADLIIGLDYGDYKRLHLGQATELSRFDFLTFDHHSVGNYLGLELVEPECSSTAEVIYSFLEFLEFSLSPSIATCLLVGIFDDTGGFRHFSTSAQTLKIAGKLLAEGAAFAKISSLVSRQSPEIKIETWRQVFDCLEMDNDLGFVYSVVSHEQLSGWGRNVGVSTVANLLNSAAEAKIVLILLEKEPGYFDGSLRSRQGQEINVAEIAKRFGGGGHRLAAGFKTRVGAEEIIAKVKSFLTINN